MKRITFCLSVLAITMFTGGCKDEVATEEPNGSQPNIDVTAYILDAEPAGAKDVITVREEAESDDEVVIVGRIGGSKDPWVEGRAAFSIVDTSLLACSDRAGDDCPAPWDYCCETDKLPDSIALVKFVDSDGRLLAASARELFTLRELQTVVVHGRAQRDDSGNLTVLADGLFVRK